MLHQALETLQQGGTLLYPTDTVWGVGCDATREDAVAKVYALKKREESKSLLCLVSSIRMLENYVETVPDVAYDLLKVSDSPLTIIYDKPKGVAANLVAADNTLGIRLLREGFAFELIKKLRRPLVSSSANVSGTPTPRSFDEISPTILNGVDYVVNLPLLNPHARPSTIIRLQNDGQVQVIRS